MFDWALRKAKGPFIAKIREIIHWYPNKGPYNSDWFWRNCLVPLSKRLFREQQRREYRVLAEGYRKYYKDLYSGQRMFHGSDRIPRSRTRLLRELDAAK
jgi:hypothetical protein